MTARSIWRPPLARLTLGLTLNVFASAVESLAVATTMPATVRELGGLPLYGWTFSAFMLTNLIGISVGGSESDRSGTPRVFLGGMVLFAGGLIVSGLAPSMAVIVAGRALQGLGAGLLWSAAYAALAQAYSVELQPRVLATLSSAWVVPGLIGPGLATVVTEHAGWRWVFLGIVPLPIVATLLALPALRRVPVNGSSPDAGARNWRALQLGAGACIALVALSLQRWQLALPLVCVGATIAISALRRLLPEGTLRARPGQPAAIASMALLNFAFFGTEAFLPLTLSHVRHAPPYTIGLSLTAAAITWTTGAWLPVKLPRVGRRTIILSGLVLLAIGIAGTIMLLLPGVPAACAIGFWAVAGLGMGLAFTSLSAAILEAATPGQAGLSSASLQLAQVIGIALATGSAGAIVATPFAGEPPTLGIRLSDLLMLSALAIALLAARRIPDQQSLSA